MGKENKFNIIMFFISGIVFGVLFAIGFGILRGLGYYIFFNKEINDFSNDVLNPSIFLFKFGIIFGVPSGFFYNAFKIIKKKYGISKFSITDCLTNFKKYKYIFLAVGLSIIWIILSSIIILYILSNISFDKMINPGNLIWILLMLALGWWIAQFLVSREE